MRKVSPRATELEKEVPRADRLPPVVGAGSRVPYSCWRGATCAPSLSNRMSRRE